MSRFIEKAGAFFRAIGRFIKRHKKLSIIGLVLVIGASAALTVLSRISSSAPTAGFSMPETTTLARMNLELTVTATGNLQSTQEKQVTSTLSYDIAEIYVEIGDTVEAGQPLCLLDDAELIEKIADMREDIADAQAQDTKELDRLAGTLQDAIDQRERNWNTNEAAVQTAYNAIEQTRINAGNTAGNNALDAQAAKDAEGAANAAVSDAGNNALVADGTHITGADGVAGVSPDAALATAQQLASDAQIRLNAANAGDTDFNNYLREFNRTQALLHTVQQMRDAVYQNAYDTEYQASRSRNHDGFFVPAYNNAYNNADVSAVTATYNKAIETRDTTYASNTKSIETAQQNYDDRAQQDSAETLREQLQDYLDELNALSIVSPIAGKVTEMTAEVGESAGGSGGSTASSGSASNTGGGAATTGSTATSGGALFTIESANSLEIPVSVAEYDAIGLREGLSATVTTDAVEDASWNAAVTAISPKASGGFFTVTVEVTSPVEQLTIGMSTTVDIIVESRQNVYAVPYDAVVTNASGQTVVYALDMQGMGGGQGRFGNEDAAGGALPAGETPENDGRERAAGAGGQQANLTENRIEIVVETGFETDYYIEISGENLTDGLLILNDPLGNNVQAAQTDRGGSGDEQGLGGLGIGGGQTGGGGMPGGGMPGGGGMPPG